MQATTKGQQTSGHSIPIISRSRRPTTDQSIVILPTTVNLTFYEGDDIRFGVQVLDQNGDAADISDAVPRSQIRITPNDESVVAEFVALVSVDDPSIILLHLPNALNVNMPSNGVWDCQITKDGDITTVASGRVTIAQEVTRP